MIRCPDTFPMSKISSFISINPPGFPLSISTIVAIQALLIDVVKIKPVTIQHKIKNLT